MILKTFKGKKKKTANEFGAVTANLNILPCGKMNIIFVGEVLGKHLLWRKSCSMKLSGSEARVRNWPSWRISCSMKRVSNQVQGEMQVGPSENIENGMGQLIRLSHGPVCPRRIVHSHMPVTCQILCFVSLYCFPLLLSLGIVYFLYFPSIRSFCKIMYMPDTPKMPQNVL